MLHGASTGQIEPGESSDAAQERDGSTVARLCTVEHYELVFDQHGKPVELGRGAMGVTYKAFDVDLRCPVTLKVISEKYLGDESTRASFLARSPRSGQRPSSQRCLCLPPGRRLENYFYAMEFVEGETLQNLIKRSGRLG